MSGMNRRGVSLGTVLVVATLLATAGIAISSVSVTHLNLTAKSSATRQAENLARSVIAQAIERVLSDTEHDYGEARDPDESLDIVVPGMTPGSTVRLTFNPDRAREWGIPYSTNNVLGDRSVSGDGKAVPAASLHLYGVSETSGKKRIVEVLLHVPPMPYAIASAGVVEARNGLVVGTISELPATGRIPTPSEPEPANVHSNANGQAIVLGSGTRIGGDVAAVGTIDRTQDSSVLILGEVLDNSDSVPLADITLSDYDPELKPGAFARYNNGSYSELTIQGASKSHGDLNIGSGGLQLDGALLFVDGDLNINGGLSGKGILACTGTITVTGSASASSESSLAILAGGDFALRGRDSTRSYLQGLIYTGGDFEAESATIVGALVTKGETDLEDVRVFHHSTETVTVSLGAATLPPIDVELPVDINGSDGIRYQFSTRVQMDETNVELTIKVGSHELVTRTFSTQSPTLLDNVHLFFQTLVLPGFTPTEASILRARVTDKVLSAIGRGLDQIDSAGSNGTTTDYAVDPSEFFSFKDRIRVVSWQEK